MPRVGPDGGAAEAARALAQRTLLQHDGDRDAVIAAMFRLLTSRSATTQEMEILAALYDDQLEHFTARPELAKKFLENGDASVESSLPATQLAAAAACAQALMNHDACIVKQ